MHYIFSAAGARELSAVANYRLVDGEGLTLRAVDWLCTAIRAAAKGGRCEFRLTRARLERVAPGASLTEWIPTLQVLGYKIECSAENYRVTW